MYLCLLLKVSILYLRGTSSILLSTCARKGTDFYEYNRIRLPQPILQFPKFASMWTEL